MTEKQIAALPRTLAERARGDKAVAKLRRQLERKSTKVLVGLFKDPQDPDYNPDADKTWAECSMRTRAALVIHRDFLPKENQENAHRVLGVVFLQARAGSADEWEQQARAVDEAERRKVIEATAEPVEPKRG